MSIRAKVHNMLDTSGTTLSWANKIIIVVILAAIGLIIFESEAAIRGVSPVFFDWTNMILAVFFTTEYLLRLWSEGEDPRYRGFTGRLRYMVTPMALVDLLSLIPFYLVFISDSFILRLFRVFRIISLIKLNRYTQAVSEISEALWNRRYEVLASMTVAFVLMLTGATVMVILEGQGSPNDFGSIPRAMWWAVITLTSVGYGDDVPISIAGRIFTGFYALVGVGLAGMVGGIMAAAMTETFQKRFMVDIDGAYPTDSDYRAYEIGFNDGHRTGFSGEPANNTFQQTSKNISEYWGYEEGYQRGLNRSQEEEMTSQ